MEHISKLHEYTFELLGQSITVDPRVFVMTWLVMGLLVVAAFLVTRSLKTIPGKVQSVVESLYEFVDDLTCGTLGKAQGNGFVPFIFTIFIFILISNWVILLPHLAHLLGVCIAAFHALLGLMVPTEVGTLVVHGITEIRFFPTETTWYYPLFHLPELMEPTRSINTNLALALLVFVVVHVNSVIKIGPIHYLKHYWGDIIPFRGWWLLLAPINLMIFMHLIGEVSALLSHAFRLSGNILGGFMIIAIVSSLVKFVLIPVGLLAFFGLFIGLVQAFVFTMLAITYIGQKA